MTEKTAKEVATKIISNINDETWRKYYFASLQDDATLHDQVLAFHDMYGSPIRQKVQPRLVDVSDEEIALRINLVAEEFREWLDAFGLSYTLQFSNSKEVDNGDQKIVYEHATMGPKVEAVTISSIRNNIDVVEIADASGDLKYVLEGADITFGIPSQKISQEIHASNMTKLDEKGQPIFREDGKIMKGEFYTPPNLEAIIKG